MRQIRKDLRTVDNMANRLSIDVKLIQSRVTEINAQSETERQPEAIEKLRENMGLLVEHIAKELTQIAIKLNPKIAPTTVETATQKTPEKRPTSLSDSTDIEHNYANESSRKSRKLKRRRKLPKNHSDISDSMNVSSNSDGSFSDRNPTRNIKDEPFVISQNLDDVINGTGSNSANESIRKENDFRGFDNVDDNEFSIKTEVMLNSESLISNQSNNEPNTSQTAMDVSKEASLIEDPSNISEDDESTQIINYDDHEPEQSKNSAIKPADVSSSADSSSDHNILDDDDDDDDEDIRKYV